MRLVSDPMHRQFFENHPGVRQRKISIPSSGFDLSEGEFDVPVPQIKFFQFLSWIKLRIGARW